MMQRSVNESNLVADVIFVRFNVLRFVRAAVTTSVVEAVILQVAFAAPGRRWGSRRVVEQQVFKEWPCGHP
jgi:RNase P/RNase MRP subunit p30